MQLGKEILSPRKGTRRHKKPDALSFSCLFVLLRGRTLAWLMMSPSVSSPTARPSNPGIRVARPEARRAWTGQFLPDIKESTRVTQPRPSPKALGVPPTQNAVGQGNHLATKKHEKTQQARRRQLFVSLRASSWQNSGLVDDAVDRQQPDCPALESRARSSMATRGTGQLHAGIAS